MDSYLSSEKIRQKFLEFFKERGHKIIPSSSLIPENDPTVLFTTAGMQPLVPYLLGQKHPAGQRLVNVQKCVRTGDIDEIGDTYHNTFFEMLGNWSFGDYFKDDAIKWSWEFLTDKKWLGIDKNRLAISIFAGDDDAPLDEESKKIWLELGVSEKRIAALPKKNNWWGPAGQTGPCGPDTEIFYWSGEGAEPKKFDADDSAWVEIWNNVFMQYNKKADGTFEPLKQKNVDTGMGLERIVAVLNGLNNVYEIDLLKPIFDKVKSLSTVDFNTESHVRSARIITDHLRASVMILGDDKGIVPSNVDQGYVLRRFIRRAIRHARLLGIEGKFCKEVAQVVVRVMSEPYPEIQKNEKRIFEELEKEDEKFSTALEKGQVITKKLLSLKNPIPEKKFLLAVGSPDRREFLYSYWDGKFNPNNKFGITKEEMDKGYISGKEAFDLFQSYGFPLEMIYEIATEARVFVDRRSFVKELEKHQELSRKGAEQKFKGGLADQGEMTTKYHTATHLLHAALRQVLGEHVQQKGSNITAERLRFDFSHPTKMTPDEIKQVEDLVNEKIKENLPVKSEEMTLEEAKSISATGVFDSKYGERVIVYSIGDFSKEICGGPHVSNTSEIGKFRITKEESSSVGIRRIRAVVD